MNKNLDLVITENLKKEIEQSGLKKSEIADAIGAYVSQEEIIKSLVKARAERLTPSGEFIEVYIAFDCRPKINFKPYIDWIEGYNHS